MLFTFGNKTLDRAYKFGARIGEVVSVGSFLMEHNWFNNIRMSKNKTRTINYDLICLGGNAHYPGSYCDIYDTHNSDYIKHLKWLRKLSIEFPDLRIGFKHHSNFRIDSIEEKIFTGCRYLM